MLASSFKLYGSLGNHLQTGRSKTLLDRFFDDRRKPYKDTFSEASPLGQTVRLTWKPLADWPLKDTPRQVFCNRRKLYEDYVGTNFFK